MMMLNIEGDVLSKTMHFFVKEILHFHLLVYLKNNLF